MTAVAVALAAASGVHLLLTPLLSPRRRPRPAASRRSIGQMVTGLLPPETREVIGATAILAAVGGWLGFVALGGPAAAAALAALVGSLPIGAHRHRRARRLSAAQEAWPSMIEEIRLQTSTLGRSIPQALFEVGNRSPEQLRIGFAAAHREWLLTTDFAQTCTLLKTHLDDPTADAALETLVVAHELGAADLDRRLQALAEDRRHDVQSRKDARSRLAGARFARRFVLFVPAGMALSGMSIGEGHTAYRSATGQLVVVIALALISACWFWAGAVMRLPHPERVFRS